MKITIDGNKAIKEKNKIHRGAGVVSGNNSSRLLIDYKAKQPEAYAELLNHLFGENGIGINHFKLEMGADINSTSGTEPCVMRHEDEIPDVTRGAGYVLAADAKKVNPNITLDMLFWSEPRWVTNAKDKHKARYKWYKLTLDAAYDKYGLVFDYVSANRNERDVDCEWIKYLSRSLKAERDCPYDYSKIKLVAADEECRWSIADRMCEDEELRGCIDVIGTHYTSWCTDKVRLMAEKYGKEIWFSEGCAPMNYAKGNRRFDGSGLSGMNGVLDIASRIVTMFPGGLMTLYEYQPAVAGYYDGVCFCHKQLINACAPWSGSYSLDAGYYMSLHFSRFIKKGWQYIDGACYSDGVPGPDGHSVVDAKYCCMTAKDPDTGDISMVIVNTTAEPKEYELEFKNTGKCGAYLYAWETRGADTGCDFKENYFKYKGVCSVLSHDTSTRFVVKPYSIVTLTTVDCKGEMENSDGKCGTKYETENFPVLELPYADDFEYDEIFLRERGHAPLYTTDQGGAFEVVQHLGKNVLMQQITPDILAEEWGVTPQPVTNFGDDRWYNYSVSAEVGFAEADNSHEKYIGVGLRCILGCEGMNGYILRLYSDGAWKLFRCKSELASGTITGFLPAASHELKIEAIYDHVRAWIDGTKVTEYMDDSPGACGAGRALLCSSYDKNYFEYVKVSPAEQVPVYVTRHDNTDDCFSYTGDWNHVLMGSFANYKRTASEGKAGDEFSLCFTGCGALITGLCNGLAAEAWLDGEAEPEEMFRNLNAEASCERNRSVILGICGLTDGKHELKIKIKAGTVAVDSAETVIYTV